MLVVSELLSKFNVAPIKEQRDFFWAPTGWLKNRQTKNETKQKIGYKSKQE